MRRDTALFLIVALFAFSSSAVAQSLYEHERSLVLQRLSGASSRIQPNYCSGPNPDGFLFCGSSSSGQWGGAGDCAGSQGYYVDLWDVSLTAGESVQITADNVTGGNEVLMILFDANANNLAEAVGFAPQAIHYTPLVTGHFTIGLGPVAQFATGNYRLTVSCNATAPPPSANCQPNTTTACMLGNRFRVQVRYRSAFDNNPVDSTAFVKPVTGFANGTFETAFFYFNNSDNIEVLVKMLDQGNRNAAGLPTIAVLYGSATPLRVQIAITDTSFNGASKSYLSEFGTQAGQTDFTAFVK